ncbi:unnamed protein product [Soboliphyme baturini]|uniref:Ovule protein n=1 Tax=Soboliphyme baturini TaxID=241478 RepID=A0A183J5F8_9BILA|nr:unnamed protein product [Soboliphyme baturini]
MDHLKCVLSQAPHNGLPQNKLCRIFGPLLSCTSVSSSVKAKETVDLLDYNLAARTLSTVLELWPFRSSKLSADVVFLHFTIYS